MTRALIVGTGPGLSSSFARLPARSGCTVALAARRTDKLAALAAETGAIAATMLAIATQHRSCWTDEIAVRPWVKRF